MWEVFIIYVKQFRLVTKTLETIPVNNWDYIISDLQLFSDPIANADGHAYTVCITHHFFYITHTKRTIRRSTAPLFFMICIRWHYIILIKLLFKFFVIVSQPLSEHCQIFHTRCKKFRFIINDSRFMQHTKTLFNMLIRQVRSKYRLDQC